MKNKSSKCEMKTPKLSAKDWVEIYYALDTKRRRVSKGDYGTNREVQHNWIAHLDSIIKKIGPHGARMKGGR